MRAFLIAAGIAVALFMSGGAKADGIMSGPCIGCAEGIYNVGASSAPVCPAPTVTAVSPNTGSTAGGTPVTITGTNFTGATNVNFGLGNAASFSVTNPTTIAVASSPAGSAGTVDVMVTTSCGISAISAADQFTYSAACTQATTFLARTSGLSGTETAAYTAMICGMVTDSTWGLFDTLYVFATNNTTTAGLNLVSTSFTITPHGTPTFTADQGYTGNASNMFLDTGFAPSANGVNYTLNSASYGACVLNSRSTAQSWSLLGAGNNSTQFNYLNPYASGGVVQYSINAVGSFPQTSATNAQGSWILSKTGATAGELYLNGAGVIAYTTAASAALTSNSYYVLGGNSNGTLGAPTSDTVSYFFLASGLTGTQAGNIYSRLHTFMTALGNIGC